MTVELLLGFVENLINRKQVSTTSLFEGNDVIEQDLLLDAGETYTINADFVSLVLTCSAPLVAVADETATYQVDNCLITDTINTSLTITALAPSTNVSIVYATN
jgi:hypothetical protein